MLVLLACAMFPSALHAVERFPQPEFESGYTAPAAGHPAAQPVIRAYLDVVLLAAALSLASYIALRRRSRREMSLLMLFCLLYFGFLRKGCVCPVGSLQNVAAAVSDPGFPLPPHVLLFFLLPLVFALFFGRTFCAAVCPLGAVQDVVVCRPVKVPHPWAHALSLIPRIYLALAVLFAALGTGFIVCRFDPFVPFFRLSGEPAILLAGGCILLGGVFVARPYCRFLCPYGVLLGWMSRLSWRHVTITPDECVRCRLCEESCPFGAILTPGDTPRADPRPAARRRLAMLLVAAPLLVVIGAAAGSRLDTPLSMAHPAVRLAEQLAGEDSGNIRATTLQSDAFRASGRPRSDLHREVAMLRRRFRNGGMLAGSFVGIVLAARLAGLCLLRSRRDYEPERGSCLSCGRCFASCPREHLRRSGRSIPAEADVNPEDA